MPVSQQCPCKGLWSTVPVSYQTERTHEMTCPFMNILHIWAMVRLNLHSVVILREGWRNRTDKACVSSTVFSYVRSHFVQVPSSHLPSQMAIQNLGNILSAKWRLSRVCRTHLTNLSQLPPQIRCYHFPPKPVIQANSSPFTKNRKTEPAKLNASNVIPLKHSESCPNITPKAQVQFQIFKHIHY